MRGGTPKSRATSASSTPSPQPYETPFSIYAKNCKGQRIAIGPLSHRRLSIGANCFGREAGFFPRIVFVRWGIGSWGIGDLCGLLHTEGGPEEPDYWRGYAIASVALAVILIAEVIAFLFLQ